MSLANLTSHDLTQVFADCGESITYQVVSQSVDPASMEINESVTDLAITALVGRAENESLHVANGQTTRERTTAMIRESDLPEDCPALTDRVVLDGVSHQVTEFRYQAALKAYQLTVQELPT